MVNDSLPRHVAIVMDGNGRWAKHRGLPRLDGHRAGVESVKTIIKSCLEKKIAFLSLFAFSSENWSRPQAEVQCLMQLFLQALESELDDLNHHQIRLCFTGDRQGLSTNLQKQMQEAESLTIANKQMLLNVVVNYGGRWHIVSAAQSIAKRVSAGNLKIEAITEELLATELNKYDIPDPDLLIRTSGEQRISNFFLWQIAYTELYFTKANWPEFTVSEFEKALTNYRLRQRRFGSISQQVDQD